jgi:predicted RNA polymerase sigma factor
MVDGPERGLEEMDRIEGLDGYQHLHSARGELLQRAARREEAAAAYRRALELATNPVERAFLDRRLNELGA